VSTTIDEKCSFFVFSEMLSPAKVVATTNPPRAQTAARISLIDIAVPLWR
jgi:hypothetical protein